MKRKELERLKKEGILVNQIDGAKASDRLYPDDVLGPEYVQLRS